MRTNKVKFGNQILVSDPCYTIDTWCNALVPNTLEGNYDVSVKEKYGRIKSITITHENHTHNKDKWKYISGDIGVDSGQCGFFNLDAYRNDSIEIPFADDNGKDFYNEYTKREEGDSWYEEGDSWYGKICGYTLQNKQWDGLEGIGLVSSSGYGDGSYDLYAKRVDDKVTALKVKFF